MQTFQVISSSRNGLLLQKNLMPPEEGKRQATVTDQWGGDAETRRKLPRTQEVVTEQSVNQRNPTSAPPKTQFSLQKQRKLKTERRVDLSSVFFPCLFGGGVGVLFFLFFSPTKTLRKTLFGVTIAFK